MIMVQRLKKIESIIKHNPTTQRKMLAVIKDADGKIEMIVYEDSTITNGKVQIEDFTNDFQLPSITKKYDS